MLKRIAMVIVMLAFICISAVAEMEIHFIDVGQADAAVIICDGETMMIDGGNSEDSSLIYSYLTKTLKLDHLDHMIATHPHEDHIGGLAGALNACSVGVLYSPVTEFDSKQFSSLTKYARKQDLLITVPSVSDTFQLGGAIVEFLSPAYLYGNVNDLSIVVRITYGDTAFLFTGDAETTAEWDIINSGFDLSADVLKVGHHGSSSSTSAEFLQAIMPAYAVISVGNGNSYGHPTEEVLSRLNDFGTTIYRTDLQGDVICRSDGTSITFTTEKNVSYSYAAQDIQNAAPDPEEESDTAGIMYIGNRNSKKFHYPDCASVSDMKEKNRVELGSREEAIDAGYVPCKRCNP